MNRLGAHVRIGTSVLATSLLAAASVCVLMASATAQQPPAAKSAQPPAASQAAPQPAPQNAAGVGSAWKAEIKDGAQAGLTLDPGQLDAIKKVDAYFNELATMQGRFIQTTSSDKKQSRGKFFVKKPGLFRFDYAPPSKLVILSDGSNLAIEDHDLRQVDRYPIDSTPFRLLLRKDVNLMRDARITDLQSADDIVILSIIDKAGDSSGAIKLFFVQKPTFELKEWVITDAQGVETRIEVAEIEKGKPIDARKFETTSFDAKPTTGQ